jgi:hypothetical protein
VGDVFFGSFEAGGRHFGGLGNLRR